MLNRLRSVKVSSSKNQVMVAEQCRVADSFFSRLKGLIGTKQLPIGEGLLLDRCNNIHMFFMAIPIDVIFIQKQSEGVAPGIVKVTSIHEGVRPWSPTPLWDYEANQTLELPVGTIRRCQIQAGDELCIS